jgi:thiol-disulfide isomerase/thioredoxin
MKKVLTIPAIVCILFPAGLTAQSGLVLVQGSFNKDKVQQVVLCGVQEGEKYELATSRLSEGKQFAFAIPGIKKGFYYLSDQYKRTFTRIYLKPGDKINIQIDEDGYTLTQSTPENQLLHDWYNLSGPVTAMSIFPRKDTITYRSFFPVLTAFIPRAEAFRKKINTPDAGFNRLFKQSIDLEIEHAALKFLLTPNSVHPAKEQYPAYYATVIEPEKYKDGSILQFAMGTDLLTLYQTFTYLKAGPPADPKAKRSLLQQTEVFGNDTIKGMFAAQSLSRYKSLEEFNQEVAPVKQFLVTDSMQARYFRALKKLSGYAKGVTGYNFSYPNVQGKQVSLADLKGKVVLIDMWATWCGPCKAEIPYLKKLEEELKDKNIAFVSISVDEEKDKLKWEKFIEKEQLGGIQLFAKGWSDFARFYDINAIPRFLVFDQQGKIVTVNSPRPSDPALKELLLNISEGRDATTAQLK